MTTNHECYVSLEVAKLLKEAGFKWFINTAYRDGVLMHQGNLLCDNFNGKQYENSARHEFFSAPTLDIAQRWLREVKNISVEANSNRWVNRYKDGKYAVSYIHELWPIDTSILPDVEEKFISYTIVCACDIEFQTYEEALEAGIKKALELILEEVE